MNEVKGTCFYCLIRTRRGKDPNVDPQFGTLGVSPEYGRTVGWQFISGRDFSNEIISDSSAIVINESTAKVLRFENPIGEIVHWKNKVWKMDNDFRILGRKRSPVVGIVVQGFCLTRARCMWNSYTVVIVLYE